MSHHGRANKRFSRIDQDVRRTKPRKKTREQYEAEASKRREQYNSNRETSKPSTGY